MKNKRTPSRKWASEEIQTLRDMFASGSTFDAIAQAIGRPRSAVLGYAGHLGLRKSPTKRSRQSNRWRGWQPEEEHYVKTWYGINPAAEIASHLGRSLASVQERARRLGVLAAPGAGRTAAPIGTERLVDGIMARKVSNTGNSSLDWKRVDVIAWEVINGPVPEGMVLLKPRGLPRAIENLRLVSPNEVPLLAAREKATPEVRKLWQLKSAFGSALGRIEKLHAETGEDGRVVKDRSTWPAADTAFLVAHRNTLSSSAIAAALGRSTASVRSRAQRLGVRRADAGWSDADDQRLTLLRQSTSIAELARLFGYSKTTIKSKNRQLGLSRQNANEPRVHA